MFLMTLLHVCPDVANLRMRIRQALFALKFSCDYL